MTGAEGFDRAGFDTLMLQGARRHNAGLYNEALNLGLQAFDVAPDDSIEKGRAARDVSARFDRLGQVEEAEVWAETAFDIHNRRVLSSSYTDRTQMRETYRESSVSAMYVGVNSLRRVIEARKLGQPLETHAMNALEKMRITRSDIRTAKMEASGINVLFDQYEINAARRVAMTESLLGKRKKGLTLGVKAVALAFMSESPRLDKTDHELSLRQIVQAKIKALKGGIGAVGVSILSLTPGKRTKLAYKAAGQVL